MRLLSFVTLMVISLATSAQNYFLFVGTYTGKGSKGIYVYRFNATTGAAEWVSNTDSTVSNPSYLALSPNGKYVYAVTEVSGKGGGDLSAFAFDRSTGALQFLNKQTTGGDHPCYVAVTRDGQWATVGNYTGGSLSLFPLLTDGRVQPHVQVLQHEGSSVNKGRQEKAHVHATVFSPNEDHLFAPDLGIDKVMVYRFDPSGRIPLTAAATPFVIATPGSGPRHFTFHPNARWAYLMEELSGTVSAYQWVGGKLTSMQRISSHPKDFTGFKSSADIHLSPDGRFLYASNRGDANSLAIFSVHAKTGKLTPVGFQPTGGKTPRNFMIDPTGNYLLVANQETNNIVVFKRNIKTGLLTETGQQLTVPNPVCLQMMK